VGERDPEDPLQKPTITRQNAKGETESYRRDRMTGVETRKQADGTEIRNEIFKTAGPLYGKLRKVEQVKNGKTEIRLERMYDDDGRLEREITPKGIAIMQYDKAGRLTSKVDEAGKLLWQAKFDEQGRKILDEIPGERKWVMEFLPDGIRRLWRWEREVHPLQKNTTIYRFMGGTEWDKSSVVQRWWVDGDREYTEIYNSLGQHVGRMMNGKLVERYVYDSVGRVTEEWNFAFTPPGQPPLPIGVKRTDWSQTNPKTGEPLIVSITRKQLPQSELQPGIEAAIKLLASYASKQ
jgi:YD repeat-containing protein